MASKPSQYDLALREAPALPETLGQEPTPLRIIHETVRPPLRADMDRAFFKRPAPNRTPQQITEAALATMVRNHGLKMAVDDLARWDLTPRVDTGEDGTLTVSGPTDPDGNAVILYQRDPKGNISISSVEEEIDLDDWLWWHNEYWGNFTDEQWHRGHVSDEDADDCMTCPTPWHAARIHPTRPLPRDRDETSLFTSPTKMLYQAKKLLACRLKLQVLQIASDYLENHELIQSTISTDEVFQKAARMAATEAIVLSITNRARRRQVERYCHENCKSTLEYRGQWAHTVPGQQKDHWRQDDDFSKYEKKIDTKWAFSDTQVEVRDIITATPSMNRMLQDQMTDREILETLEHLSENDNRNSPSMHWDDQHETGRLALDKNRYQDLAKNYAGLAPLAKTSPALASIYLERHAWKGEPIQHPGQAIQRMKGRPKMKAAAWKILCRIAPHINDTYKYHRWNGNRHTLRQLVEMLARANRPEASDSELLKAAGMNTLHERHWFRPPRRFREQHREAWTRTLNAFLGPGGPERTTEQLRRVSDAITGIIRDGERWGTGSWETMLAREQRWHREIVRRPRPGRNNGGWESLVDEYQDGKYTVTPVVTGAGLRHTADLMENCLDTYYETCRRGGTRVFTLRLEDGALVGALELEQIEGDWELGAVEAMEGENATEAVRKAAERLLKEYRRAAKER